ncbi:putative replicative DNA helicase [Calothrix sp. PCC 7716]|nr:putative replicative DNA helicase [Calothrix sp. PCC 7716]
MVNALTFGTFTDRMPPHNLEAEESVLGSILLDPQAITLVRDILPVEAFYLEIHQDIYRAALNLCKQGTTVCLPTVIRFLEQRGNLRRVGGLTNLTRLFEAKVSALGVDETAKLLLEDYLRRQIILLANETLERGHDPHLEIADLVRITEEKFTSIEDYGLKGGDRDEKEYNNLMASIKNIERTVSSPGLKLYKLQKLAKTCGKRLQDLEFLYIKSLCEAASGPLKTLEALNMDCKTDTREWLVHGIIPANTTFLIHALGGVGKTKLLYDLAYCLIEGKDWNQFAITAKSRKVLIYQDDESPYDMRQALQRRGFFEPGFNSEHFRYRRGWTMDNVPQLVRDIEEFQPDLVIIDSITTANRNSIFSENETAYARPLLEITQIAAEYGVTVGLIHHSNGEGGSRGTKAIFNSVSEVLCLKRSTEPGANEQEKILEIQKSRSRRFPCSYNLFFNAEDFSLSCTGEINQRDTSDEPVKARILRFLQDNRGVRFEAEEIAHETETATGSTRRCLNRLASDGLISVLEVITDKARKNLYFIDFDEPTHQSSYRSKVISPDQSYPNADTEPVTDDSTQNTEKNQEGKKVDSGENLKKVEEEESEAAPDKDSEEKNTGVIRTDHDRSKTPILTKNGGGEESNPSPVIEEGKKKQLKPICIKLPSTQGTIQVNATPINDKVWDFKVAFPDGYEIEEQMLGNKKQVVQGLQAIVDTWNAQFKYTVQVLKGLGTYESIKDCTLIQIKVSPANPLKGSWLFESPTGKAIFVHSPENWEIQK